MEIFQLEKVSGELSLKKELDREIVDTHYLVVVITNFIDGPQTIPEENSKLRVTIHVIIFVCLFVCLWRHSPQWAMASLFTRFLDHTQLRITFGGGLLWTSDQLVAETST
jgi:hypothetical protein